MVYRMELTYDEVLDIPDIKCIAGSAIGYTLPPGVYEISDLNLILKSLLLDEVRVNITIDDIRLRSNLTTAETKKSFFHTILGFTQSHSGPLGKIEGFNQKIPGTYKSEKPINITGIDNVHLNCNCVYGSIVNGIREPILYSFALDKPPGHKIFKEPRLIFFEKVKKSVLSHSLFYLEDDDHKLVDFNGETIYFTFQLVKI